MSDAFVERVEKDLDLYPSKLKKIHQTMEELVHTPIPNKPNYRQDAAALLSLIVDKWTKGGGN